MKNLLTLGVVLTALAEIPAFGASGTWNGTNTNVWSTAGNWSSTPLAAPGSADTATFANAGNGNTTISLGGNTAANIVFDTASVAAYTLGSGAVGSQSFVLNNGNITVNSTVTNNQLFNANVTLGTATAGAYVITNNGSGNLTFAGTVAGGTTGTGAAKTLNIAGTGNTFISGTIVNGSAASLALTKTGTGTLTLSGSNTYTGPVSPAFTTIVGTAPATINATPATAEGGGTLKLDFSATGAPVSNILASTGNLSINGGSLVLTGKASTNNSQTLAGVSIGTGFANISLTAGSGGKVVFNLGALSAGQNGYGQLNIDLPSGTQDATNGVTTTNVNTNGILTYPAPGASSGTMVTINRTDWGTNATNTSGGNIVAYTGYTANGTGASFGTLTTNVNVTTDATLTGAGNAFTLRFNTAATTGLTNTINLGSQTLTVGKGAIMVTANVGSGNVTLNGGTLVGASNRGMSIYQYDTSNSLIINSVIADNISGGSIGIAGGGRVVFGGTNTFSGGVLLNKDTTLALSSDTNLAGRSGTLNVASASTGSTAVTLSAAAPAGFGVGSAFLGTTVSAISGTSVTLAANANATIGSATSVSWAGQEIGLSLDGGIIEATGSFNLTQTNSAGTAGGPATTNRNVGLAANGGTFKVDSGATLGIAGVVSSAATTGYGALAKTGAGTLNLSGANTYSGGTTITGGTLRVNNTSGSGTGTGAVAVKTGATLGGGNTSSGLTSPGSATKGVYAGGVQGLITGAVTVEGGGHLAPGNSVGTITMASLTLNAASQLDYEFNATANDFASISTTLTLNGGAFNLYQEGTTTAFAAAGTYDLLSYGTLAGTGIGALSVANMQSGFSYTFINDTTDKLIQVQIAVVPEPGTWAMMLGGLGALMLIQRRRTAGRL